MRNPIGYGPAVARTPVRPPNPKAAIAMVLVAIIVVTVLVVYSQGAFGTGYKFSVSGVVEFDVYGNWHLKSITTTEPVRDWKVFSSYGLPFLDSGDVKVRCTLGEYEAEDSLGSFSRLGTEKTFTCTFRHVEEGSYYGDVFVIEKICGIIPINCQENEVKHTVLNVEV